MLLFPAEDRLSRTNQNAPTPMPTIPPGNVQWHQEEYPTCVCHIKLQITAELKSPSSAGCLLFCYNQEFQVYLWFKVTEVTFLLPERPGGRNHKQKNKIYRQRCQRSD